MGRKSGMSAIEGVESLARAESKSGNWGIVGWVGSLTAFFILTFYMVISVWLIAYLMEAPSGVYAEFASDVAVLNSNIGASVTSISDQVSSFDVAAPCAFIADGIITQITQADGSPRDILAGDISGCRFGETTGNTWGILFLLALFLIANVFVVGRGVKGGIERAATILMPAFFVMLLVVVGFAISQGNFAEAAAFIFEPKWGDVGFKTFLSALGQAFFSIGVGVGLMITYGAYLDRQTNIPRSSAIVVTADTTVALIAGFAIFPIVFMAGLDPAGGPSLFFVSMPVAFGGIDGGTVFATVFFALALFAAFTSSISLMEVGVSWLEERQGVTRLGAAIGVGFVLWMIGAAYVFSLEYLDFVDFMTEGLLLPLGGLLAAIFAGWILSRQMLTSELGEGNVMNVWRFLIRWFVPPFVAFVLVFGFLDKIQDQYNVPLPGVLTALLGPNS